MRPWTALLLVLLTTTCASAPQPPALTVVPQVDLSRYMGTWYEIASYPTWFQKGCTGSTARYRLSADGTVDVLNQCRKGDTLASAHGTAWVPDPAVPAKLKVRFFWPFSADYWIIDLGPEYEYAVVGHPSRGYLWILSRTRVMDPAVYAGILQRLRRIGYDPDGLVRTDG